MIASALSALAALSFLSLAGGSLAAPQSLAKNYGLPASDPVALAYLRAVGARDGALGLLILWCLRANAREALAATVACSSLAGAADFMLVASARGREGWKNLTLHGVGTAGLLVIFAALRLERARGS